MNKTTKIIKNIIVFIMFIIYLFSPLLNPLELYFDKNTYIYIFCSFLFYIALMYLYFYDDLDFYKNKKNILYLISFILVFDIWYKYYVFNFTFNLAL